MANELIACENEKTKIIKINWCLTIDEIRAVQCAQINGIYLNHHSKGNRLFMQFQC